MQIYNIDLLCSLFLKNCKNVKDKYLLLSITYNYARLKLKNAVFNYNNYNIVLLF